MMKILLMCRNSQTLVKLQALISSYPFEVETVLRSEDLRQGSADDFDAIVLAVDTNSAAELKNLCSAVAYFSCPVHVISALGRTENLYILNQLANVPSLLVYDSPDFSRQFCLVLEGLSGRTPVQAETWEIEQVLDSSQQISPLADQIEKLTVRDAPFAALPRLARTVASELIRSAIYIGLKEQGNTVPANFGTTVILKLRPDQRVTVRSKIQGQYLVINVSDTFGTLDAKEILSHLYQYAIRTNQSYSEDFVGLGYFIVYNICSDIAVEVRPSISTSITVRILIARRNKEFDSQKTSIRVCSIGPGV